MGGVARALVLARWAASRLTEPPLPRRRIQCFEPGYEGWIRADPGGSDRLGGGYGGTIGCMRTLSFTGRRSPAGRNSRTQAAPFGGGKSSPGTNKSFLRASSASLTAWTRSWRRYDED